MSLHLAHNMHPNSLLAYELEKRNLTKRKAEVFSYIYAHQKVTDRQVMQGLGYTDMNAVRPRITELINQGHLLEDDSIICPVTKKSVRTVSLPAWKPQDMFDNE